MSYVLSIKKLWSLNYDYASIRPTQVLISPPMAAIDCLSIGQLEWGKNEIVKLKNIS